MTKSNIFFSDLSSSLTQSSSSLWLESYTACFPNMVDWRYLQDKEYQAMGIDRVVKMSDGTYQAFDDKFRDVDYGDILLEVSSSTESQTKGWIDKPLKCDYIAYMVVPSRTVYFIPFAKLQETWQKNRDNWTAKYFHARTFNTGYTSIGICVAVSVIFATVPGCLKYQKEVRQPFGKRSPDLTRLNKTKPLPTNLIK